MIGSPTDQETGNTTKTIKKGNHLRHLGHGNQAGRESTNDCTDGETKNNPLEINNFFINKCRYDGQEHPYSGYKVSTSGCRRRAQHFQTINKQYSRDDIN